MLTDPAIESPSDLVRRAMQEHESALVGYAAGIVGDLDLARDIVQDTFLKLYEQEPGRIAAAGLRSWLFTVCRNRGLDALRRRRRTVSLQDEPMLELASREPTPAEAAEHAEEAGALLRLLARLPANQREVIRLKFQNDLSYKEISEITGLSATNVGFLIHTGIKRLRQMLQVPHAETVPA
jgi:RNA polymerase sigma-70 factor (ECF subfamily)